MPRAVACPALLTACLLACSTPHPTGGPKPHGPVTQVPPLDGTEGCGPYSPAAVMSCVDTKRIRDDVHAIAVPRPPGSPQHARVRELCRDRLAGLGYEVSVQRYGDGQNVVGYKAGFSRSHEVVVVSAHYDGVAGCAAADDNASGVAAALETARVLATVSFDRALVVACWDGGELGQLGSRHYAEQARQRDVRIVVAFSFEAVGYASSEPDTQTIPDRFEEIFPDEALAMLDSGHRGDFLTVVADVTTEEPARAVVRHGIAAGLPTRMLTLTEAVKAKQQSLHRSDHASFWDAGYPALLLTDTGSFRNPRVRCQGGADTPESLDYEFTARATRAGVGALSELLELR